MIFNDRRKIHQARIQVLHYAARRLDAVKRVPYFGDGSVEFRAHAGGHIVIDRHAAHNLNAVGDGAQTVFQLRHFAPAVHRFDQERLDYTPRALRLREAEQFRFVLFRFHKYRPPMPIRCDRTET